MFYCEPYFRVNIGIVTYYSMFEPAEIVRRQAGRRGIARRQLRAAKAVPLLALRRRQAAPDQPQPVPVELEEGRGM